MAPPVIKATKRLSIRPLKPAKAGGEKNKAAPSTSAGGDLRKKTLQKVFEQQKTEQEKQDEEIGSVLTATTCEALNKEKAKRKPWTDEDVERFRRYGADAERVWFYNRVKPAYFSQYLPADEEEERKLVMQRWPKSELAKGYGSSMLGKKAGKGAGIFRYLESPAYDAAQAKMRAGQGAVAQEQLERPIGPVTQGEKPPAVAGTGQTTVTQQKVRLRQIPGTQKQVNRLVVPTSALAPELPRSKRVVGERPGRVLVLCSLFVGVMLNMQDKYGIDLAPLLARIFPEEASKSELKAMGMTDEQIMADQADFSIIANQYRFDKLIEPLKSAPPAGVTYGTWNQVKVHKVSEAKAMDAGFADMQYLVKRWESIYPGVLGWRGSQYLSIDLQRLYNFEDEVLKKLGLASEVIETVSRLPRIFTAELEAEAEKRSTRFVFRGLDGSRSVWRYVGPPVQQGKVMDK
ncbi:Hypothetical protein D9617_18g033780 [Elsinoe fawcettii]|nr:Hypothetical protein D9617_18g033780 [Elsinoe fawcettii]